MGNIRKLNNAVNIIGKNLKKLRLEKNLSQEDLCRELSLIGVTMYRADIYEIENNKRLVKDFELKAFAIIFNVSADTLLKDSEKYFDWY